MSYTRTFHKLQKEVPAQHYAILCDIINSSNEYGYAFKKNGTMAVDLGLSKRKIQYSMAWLRVNGYIKTFGQFDMKTGKQKENRHHPQEKALAYVEKFEKVKRSKVVYECKEKELFAALAGAQKYLNKVGFTDAEMKEIRRRGREIIRTICDSNSNSDKGDDNVVNIDNYRPLAAALSAVVDDYTDIQSLFADH